MNEINITLINDNNGDETFEWRISQIIKELQTKKHKINKLYKFKKKRVENDVYVHIKKFIKINK